PPLRARGSPAFPARRSADLVFDLLPVAAGGVRAAECEGQEAAQQHDRENETVHRPMFARGIGPLELPLPVPGCPPGGVPMARCGDRKSTRLNSSHVKISYAV